MKGRNKFEEFFENSTVDGLRYVFGHYRKHRLFWTALLIFACLMTIWSGVDSIRIYRRFDVKTSLIYQNYDQIDYPAISICTENVFKRSAVGFNDMLLSIISSIFSDGSLYAQATNNRTCYYSGSQHGAMDVQTIISFNINKDMGQLLSKMAPSSENNVANCWWNGAEIDCKGLFYNHIDFVGMCYTFNINEKVVEAGRDENGFVTSYGYGLNVTNYKHRTSSWSGPGTGLKLLLNVDQSNYCGISRKWHGAGFRIYIHDSLEVASYYVDKSILIPPGFYTKVFISPISIRRNTENLGRCVSSADLKLIPVKGFYSQKSCIYDCGMRFVYDTCHCTIFVISSYREKFAEMYKIPADKVAICSLRQISCATKAYASFVEKNFDEICPKCKTPCSEIKYEYKVTTLRFPSGTSANETKQKIDQKNMAMVSFSNEDNNVMILVETQAYSLLDLFTCFGGTMGLFLGISVASLGEIFHFVFDVASHFFEQNKLKKVRKIQRRSVILSLDDIYGLETKSKKNRRRSTLISNRVTPV